MRTNVAFKTQTDSGNSNDLGSGSITDGSNFVLTSDQWIAIQTYIVQGVNLPQTAEALATALKTDVNTINSDFSELLTLFQSVGGHCTTWQQTVYPAVVGLAANVINYADNAPTYYNPLQQLVDELQQNPNDSDAANKFKETLQRRIDDANTYQGNASNVGNQIKDFANNTSTDKSNADQLVSEYQAKYGSTSGEMKDLQDQIKSLNDEVAKLNKEYNHDVTVAATTATYAWVGFPFLPIGLLAAVPVAATYGAEAKATKEKIGNLKSEIETDQAQYEQDLTLLGLIGAAQTSLQSLDNSMTIALGLIQNLEGAWDLITGKLNGVVTDVNNIASDPSFLQTLDIQAAISDWQKAGSKATAFVANAYITVNSGS